jgi:putative flippase GtrA
MNGEETSVPTGGEPAAAAQVRIVSRDDLQRSRLTVFFRFLLALPHLIVLGVWGLIAILVAVINWFALVFTGRGLAGVHDLQSRYLRYFTQVDAYLNLAANPYPRFSGDPGGYPFDIEVPEERRQNRWKTGFRLILAFPAAILAGAVGNALYLVALFGWFVGLILGRMPRGLRNLGVFALRYQGQLAAYAWLLTDRYPYSGPSLELAGAEAVPVPELT